MVLPLLMDLTTAGLCSASEANTSLLRRMLWTLTTDDDKRPFRLAGHFIA